MTNSIHPKLEPILQNIEKVIVGKRQVAELSLVALLAKGHVLLEDVPGVGKTTLVKSMAKSINATYKRIQFTPDLLPTDVTGVSVFTMKPGEFHFNPGPIMGNIVLADEINRTSPKTQSALLEAMEEHAVTVDGVTRQIIEPFFVMATQNPIEYEGTYALPEAQLDRFLLKLSIGYPDFADEMAILQNTSRETILEQLTAVLSTSDIVDLQVLVNDVLVDDTIRHYIVNIVQQTRTNSKVDLGASPRATIALMRAAQAYAFLRNRHYVIPDDVQLLAPFVLAHRIILKTEAIHQHLSAEEIVNQIIRSTPIPIDKVAT